MSHWLRSHPSAGLALRIPGCYQQALQLFTCPRLGKWGLGKQRHRGRVCCTATESCPESRASSSEVWSWQVPSQASLSKEEHLRVGSNPSASSFFPSSPAKLAPKSLIPSSSEGRCGENLEYGQSEREPMA